MTREQIYKTALEEIGSVGKNIDGEDRCNGCYWRLNLCLDARGNNCKGNKARAAIEAAAKVGTELDDDEKALAMVVERIDGNQLSPWNCAKAILRDIDAYLRGAR